MSVASAAEDQPNLPPLSKRQSMNLRDLTEEHIETLRAIESQVFYDNPIVTHSSITQDLLNARLIHEPSDGWIPTATGRAYLAGYDVAMSKNMLISEEQLKRHKRKREQQ